MISKRIIPCLDVMNGRVVKGVNFKEIKDMADPVKWHAGIAKAGADEHVLRYNSKLRGQEALH